MSDEKKPATGGAVRGWDFGLVGERAHPFPLPPSHPLVGANGLCAKPEFFIDGAPVETSYVAIRLKASEPLSCPECGTLNNLTHDEDCAFAAAFDDDGSEDDDVITISALREAKRACFSTQPPAPAPWLEDWLPLGRGGERRFFNTLDEYMAARVAWVRMTTREREAHLTARDGLTHKLTEIGRLMARRRKIIAKAKRASPTDSAIGSAIAAMNKPGRAHEL